MLRSRLLTKSLIVVGILVLVFGTQIDRAVKTAYDTEWTRAPNDGSRLPTETWEWLLQASGPVAIVLLLCAATLWHERERKWRRDHGDFSAPDVKFTPVAIWAAALVLAFAGAWFRHRAASNSGGSNLTLATVCNFGALGAVIGYALVVGNLVYLRVGGVLRVLRGVFRRQRVNMAIVLFLAAALLLLGDTSGQSVDSIRSWIPYVFDGEEWSAAGAARLTLGLAAALLFSLALYEGGIGLATSRSSCDGPAMLPLAFIAGGVMAVGALVFVPQVPMGPGLLVAGVILGLLALLERPNVERAGQDVAAIADEMATAHAPTRAELNVPEWIAAMPLLALAAVSVTATVEAALSTDWRDGNARLSLLPAILLGLLAIALTRRRPQAPHGIKGFRWILWTLVVLFASLIVVLIAHAWEGEIVMTVYAAAWIGVLGFYARRLFHRGEEPSQELVVAIPAAASDPEAEAVATGARVGTLRRFAKWLARFPGYIEKTKVPFVLGPVAVGGGLAVGVAVHVRPIEASQLLGVFTLAFVALALAIPFTHLAVRASLRFRPPKLLWWFGMNQVPVLTLLVVWWIAVGLVQTESTKTETLHDVRLVERTPIRVEADSASGHASDLEQYFKEWLEAQDDRHGTEADGPIPLVLVAAHGGGIRAAYWTVVALDCIVGSSAGEVTNAEIASTDAATIERLHNEACSSRRNDGEQQSAARRIFMASGVSGGAVGLYAYARQLIHNGKLGQPKSDQDDWIDAHLSNDFAAPAIGWALFHDIPNRLFGFHPETGGRCGWELLDVCYQQDRAAVLEDTFDAEWEDPASSLAQLRRIYDLRFAAEKDTSRQARLVPLLAMNSTLTGGKARAVISAADLGAWPRADAGSPGTGDDTLPLAGTIEIRDALCNTQDMRLSTAAFLAARFPYVTPSGRVPPRCGYGGKLEQEDQDESVYCAHDVAATAARCEGNYVDGGYTDNSGLFTLISVWPSLRALIIQHNIDAESQGLRKIAPLIVELDNHYQRSRQPAVPSGGTAAETLIPPLTAFGGRSAIQTYARAAAYRILPTSCTVTISPALHPGLIAPLGWELSAAARLDLRDGLKEPHPTDKTGEAVKNLLVLQSRFTAAGPAKTLGRTLKACEPRQPCPPLPRQGTRSVPSSVTPLRPECVTREEAARPLSANPGGS